MGKMLRLLLILRSCERYRIKAEKEKRKKEREKKKKNLEEYLPYEKKEKKQDEEEKDGETIPAKLLKAFKKLFFSFGGVLILCMIFLIAGIILGYTDYAPEKITDRYKYVLFFTAALVIIQMVPAAQQSLYRETNLRFYVTMPFLPEEIATAKLLQLLPSAYRIMAEVILPLWIGYSVVRGFSRNLSAAVLVTTVFVPGFLMVVIFLLLILLFSYRRILFIKNKSLALSVPAAVIVIIGIILAILELVIPGSFMSRLFSGLVDILIFNFALKEILRGQILLPVLAIFLFCVLILLAFLMTARVFYRWSLLQRWDLAEVRTKKKTKVERIFRKHRPFTALVLREIRTVKGLKLYRIPSILTCLCLPLFLLVFLAGTESYLVHLFNRTGAHEMIPALVLLRVIVPLTIVPAFVNKAAATMCFRDYYSYKMLLRMPIASEQQVKAKAAAAVLFCASGTTVYVLAGTIWLIREKILPAWGIFWAVTLHIILLVWVSEFRVMRDIRLFYRYDSKEKAKKKMKEKNSVKADADKTKEGEKDDPEGSMKESSPKEEEAKSEETSQGKEKTMRELLRRKGRYSYFLLIPAGILLPVCTGIALESGKLNQGFMMGMLIFLAGMLMLIGYFDLFINGIKKIEEMSREEEEEEKQPWDEKIEDVIADRLRRNRKSF